MCVNEDKLDAVLDSAKKDLQRINLSSFSTQQRAISTNVLPTANKPGKSNPNVVGYYGDLINGDYYSTIDRAGKDKKFHKTVTDRTGLLN